MVKDTLKTVLKKCNSDIKYYDAKTKTLNVKEIVCSNLTMYELNLLNEIEIINGDLICSLNKFDNLSSFNNLKNVKQIVISQNEDLKFITGFNLLEKMTSLCIHNNKKLNKIIGFNTFFLNISEITSFLKITNNPLLENISFLIGIKKIGSSLYLDHNCLKSLNGLEPLEYVGASFSLSSNNLKYLKELKNLKAVNGMLGLVNNNLETLKGLENLVHLKTVTWNNNLRTIAFSGNPKLKDISALYKLRITDRMSLVFLRETNS